MEVRRWRWSRPGPKLRRCPHERKEVGSVVVAYSEKAVLELSAFLAENFWNWIWKWRHAMKIVMAGVAPRGGSGFNRPIAARADSGIIAPGIHHGLEEKE
ncbi:hypothetical protein SESBI_05518 [Sesbania bispinosa]|nr:hypothetical protein SESBI_05518 [Sesbania bispinosa]